MKQYFKILITFLLPLQLLFAEKTVVVTKSGGVLINGKWNLDNTVTITLTHSSGEAADAYIVKAGFKNGSGVTNYTVNLEDYCGQQKTVADGGSNSWDITPSCLKSANSGNYPTEGWYVDLILYDPLSPATTVVNSFGGTGEDGGHSEWVGDFVDPYILSSTSNSKYPKYYSNGFNTLKVTYYLNENVTSDSYTKYVNTSSSVEHKVNLSGDGLTAGAWRTVSSGFSNGALTNGNSYNWVMYLVDVNGNTATADYSSPNHLRNWNGTSMVYDNEAPTITKVESTSDSDTYIKDQSIDMKLTFSEQVYTTGTMTVKYETGDTEDGTSTISSYGSSYINSQQYTTKTFTYTVGNNHETSKLKVHGTNGVTMASNTYIYDRADNAVSNYNLGSNIDANKTIVVDGKLPTITSVTSTTSDNTYGIGKDINVKTTFSEPVISTGSYVVTLETGGTDGTATKAAWSSQAQVVDATYTVASPHTTSGGNLAASGAAVSSGAIKDVAGNTLTDFTIPTNISAASAIKVETTLPTIKNITSSTDNGKYGIGDDVNVTVTFEEAVNLTGGTISVPLETGDDDYTVAISAFSNSTTGSGTYTVRENDDTNDENLGVKTDPGVTTSGTIKDHPAGNTMAVFSIPDSKNLSDTKAIKIDAKRPTITNATSSDNNGTYKIGDNIEMKLEFSEKITLANGTLDLSLNHGNSSNLKVSVSAFSEKTSATKDYTVAVGDTTNDLDITSMALSASNTTLLDLGSNAPSQLTPTTTLATNKNIVIDGNRPKVMKIRSTSPAGYYKVGDVIPIVLYFTEAVTTTAANIITGTLETGSTNADATVVFPVVSNGTTVTKNYTVRENDFNSSLTMNTIAVSSGQRVNDQAGNEMTDKSIPSGKNLADEIVDIFVDGVVPVDPGTAITMVSTGGNVVADKYNDTNTGVDFTVAIQSSDASLVGGTIQIKAKIAPNGWTSIGDPHTITDANKTAGSATISVLSAPIEALTGFVTDAEIKIKTTVTDVAGNSTDWAESTNSLTVDVTRPTITSATSTTDAGLYNTADAINTTLGFSEAVTLSGGDLTITLNTTGTSTVAEADLSSASTASTTYTVSSGEATADKTPAMLTVSNVNVTAGELKDGAGNPMIFPVTSIASNIADIKTIEVDGIDPTKMAIQSVKTVGDTIRSGYWNEDNTSVKVRVGLDKDDASLAGGTIQITAQISGSYESIGTAATIIQDSVALEYQTIEIANTISGGTKGLEELSNWAELATVNFKATVTDKAGNSTGYDAASTTLIIDQTDPSTFTMDSVITVTSEVVYGYWNEDNTAINVQIPIENDATLENGTVQIQAEADGTFEFIGAGSINSIATAISSSDLGTEKIISINGASTLSTIKELEELNGFGDTDVITFRAIIVDVAGNSTVGNLSPTEMTVDQTDPGKPVVDLKSSSDTGIADWDNLTKDDTPAITLTNLTNTDSVFLKIATTAVALAQQDAIDVRDKTTSTEKDLTATSHANGTYLVSAKAKDKAGNWGADATAITVRIDTIPPDIPKAPDMLVSDDSGLSDSDNITSNLRPHFIMNGLSSALDSLRLVIDGGSSIGRDSIMSQAATDTFRVSTDLANGYHTAGIIAIDSAGNIQDTSVVLAFVIDNVAPSIPTAPDMTTATDFGQSSTDNVTKAQKPIFDMSNLEAGTFINLYRVNSTPDTLLAAYDTVAAAGTSINLTPINNLADGTYKLYATSEDTAGNKSESDDLTNVIIDATLPTITTHYYNKTIHTAYAANWSKKANTDSVKFGKGSDELELIANISEPAGTNPEPTLDVTYGSNSTDSFSGLAKTSKSNSDSTWTWKFVLPTPTKNDGTAKVSFTAYDIAGNLATAFTDTQVFVVDNTVPAAFTTGLGSTHGDTSVSMIVENKTGWFINNKTDSIKVLVDIDATDNSLVGGGLVDIQARVRNKMVNTWASVNAKNTTNPFFPNDSTEGLGTGISFFRKKSDITVALTSNGLVQGDTIDVRALIYDRVLNSTAGTLSETFFVLDTLPPAQRPFFGDTLFTSNNVTSILTVNRDTLWTNDTIRFAFNNWVDSVKTNEKASGINRYEYALYQSTKANPDETNPKDWTKFRDYRSISLDTVNTDTFALTHNLKYYVALKSVDIAGNTSDTLTTLRTLRHNAYPIVDTVRDTTADEDVLWEQLLTVNDKDLFTIRSDIFSYVLTTMKLDTTKLPIDSTVVTGLNAEVSTSGKVTFTPTKLDTAAYVFRVIVTDAWTLKDTVDINITALPVNDPPIINLSSIAKLTFLEGANSDSINLTEFAFDEDDSTKYLKYSFRIASKLPGKGGYPIAKFGFLSDFSSDYKKFFINKLVDEFPASTIIQQNNSFVVYPANVTDFKDPIKVDSMVVGDTVKAWITQTDTASLDTNYYTSSDMMVEFTITDPGGLSGSDTVTFFINPINDPPVWGGIPDTVVKENDSLYLDFANYLSDVDDSTLTLTILPLTYDEKVAVESDKKDFEKKATGYVYTSQARKDTVKFKPASLWFKKDSGPWNPKDSLSNQIKFKVSAADGDTSAIDTFILRVQRVPRPEIRMYVVQNNAFTNYYEIFLVDSVGKTQDLTLKVQSKTVTLDTAAAFTYVGHYNFKTKGTYTFEVAAKGIVGDTSVTQNLGLALAKMYGIWSGRSADGQFHVIGKNGAVDFDQSIMILDSTLFEPYFNDRASYLLGNEAFRFKKSVEISMPGEDEELALYQRSTGSGWVELPSITQGNRVMAYTEKMGYFRMGPKTLIVPGQTALKQNYPNPFNPITTIEYDLGFVDGPFQKVNLTVYDILGRNVKTLVNEQQGIGRYRLKWNGKDQNGVPVASGIYFVHLLTDMGRSQTKKIMLIR